MYNLLSHPASFWRKFFLQVLICLLPAQFILGQNLSLDSPDFRDPFPHVSTFGAVDFTTNLGALDCGGELQLPVQFMFSSLPGTKSPYLGSGWIFPLLEAHAELVNEFMMRVTVPSGDTMVLAKRRDTEDFETYNGLWKGTMNGDHKFVVARSDGYEMTFIDGQIDSLKTNLGQQINWIRAGKLVTDISTAGNSPILHVNWNSNTGFPDSMIINGKELTFSFDKRPIVEDYASQKVVSRLDPSLHQINNSSQVMDTYKFSVTKDNLPSMMVTDGNSLSGADKLLTWDPKTGSILSDGKWAYSIDASNNQQDPFPKIYRSIGGIGGKESMHSDFFHGTYTVTKLNGDTIETSYFNSGLLQGQVRFIDKTSKGKTTRVFKADYDDKGRLVRTVSEEGLTSSYAYSTDGRLASYQGVPLWTGGIDKMPQELKGIMKSPETWRNDHPIFTAVSKTDGSSLLMNSTHLVSSSDWKVLSDSTSPDVYKFITYSGPTGELLRYLPGLNMTFSAPSDAGIQSPETTIWNEAELEKDLANQLYSIGATSNNDGTNIFLVNNQEPTRIVTYTLDKTGELKQITVKDGIGSTFTENYTYSPLDNGGVSKQMDSAVVNPFVNKSISWTDALDLVIANNQKSN